MGPVTFNIKNTSGYTLVVDNSTYGLCATVHPNTDAVLLGPGATLLARAKVPMRTGQWS